MKESVGLWKVICVSACVWHVLYGAKSGEYIGVLESFDNFPDQNRDFADWHFSLKRVSKNERVVTGYYTVKEDIVGPKLDIEAYFLTNNKFVKIDLNSPGDDLCHPDVISFFNENFHGNSTWTDDCIMKPGHMVINPDKPLDPNEAMHKVFSKVFYGTFKLILSILNKDGKVAMKMGWVATTKSKE